MAVEAFRSIFQIKQVHCQTGLDQMEFVLRTDLFTSAGEGTPQTLRNRNRNRRSDESATVDEFPENLVDIQLRQQNNTLAFSELTCLPISPVDSYIFPENVAVLPVCLRVQSRKIVDWVAVGCF